MDVNQNIYTLKQQGFVNIGSSILEKSEINELSDLSKRAYLKLPQDHDDHIRAIHGGEGVRRLPQHNPRISELLNKILSDNALKKILTSVMNDGYKIWGVHFRRSCPGESGLYLHQDAVGQVSIAISLDDNIQGVGATFFLPSSHWIPDSLKKLGLELSHKLVSPLRFLFSPLSSHKGDVSVFTNRTWHGRLPNNTNQEHDVILIGMFPDSCIYGYDEWSNEYIESIKDMELNQLIEYPKHATIFSDRESFNISSIDKNIFSLNLENPSVTSKKKQSFRLFYTVQLLKLVMLIKKLLSPIVRLGRQFRT